MKEKLPSLVKIHLFTVLMTACSAGGNGILGAAYMAAVFEDRLGGWIGLAISELVMFLCADLIMFTKYTGILAVMAAFTVIARLMKAGGDAKSRGIYAGIAVMLLEFTDRLFEPFSLQSMAAALCQGVVCSLLAILFAKGIAAFLAGEVSFLKQKSENMISAACFLAAAAYAVMDIGVLPDYVAQSLCCLLLLYMGHACGPAMGAVTGAAVGLVLSFSLGDVTYLGILCFLGLLCGLFRDLGRFAQTLAFLAGTAGMMFCGVPFLTQLRWLSGALAAGGIWIFTDVVLTLRRQGIKRKTETECAGTVPPEKLQRINGNSMSAAKIENFGRPAGEDMAGLLGEFAREVLNRDRNRAVEEDPHLDPALYGRFWEAKYLEAKETLAVWLGETGEILKSADACGREFSAPEEEQAGMLRKLFRERGIQTYEILQKYNLDGQMELRFQWSMRGADKRKQAAPVMVKELIPLLDQVFGVTFEPARENRSLVGKERAVYEFVQTPNFRILHGSATTKKNAADANGDTFEISGIGTSRILFGIADGTGSGKEAAGSAAHALDCLEQLLKSGVSEETSLRLMDALELMGEEQGAALDFGVINLNSGICHLLKAGGAPGFILRGSWVEMIRAKTLPLGLMPDAQYEQNVKKLYDGDIILLVSDGVIQAFPGEEKEMQIGNFLTEAGEMGPKEIARCLLDKALSFGKATDDMSVLAIGVYEA